MRLKYPSSIKIIRVPCTGKVDLLHVLRAFEKGADGVYVVGCEEGSCQYTKGNFRARKRIEQAQNILETIGIGGERAQMYNLSSGEGTRFAQFAIEMEKRIQKLGPNPIKLAHNKSAA
ncbi:MAG: hydrogenase iron-sulfur subunit [Proteobacteria bacterium]|nr:hydrogenase iron-sulfur subunit [Pseudomonadota bacterium]MBU4471836.1 hydrogenase iron-sulfur subunit [Pseudomonadota bacterium]MCG2750616.1 hydrogenase iron-sulfur subunit [Desulfobacteraceae bacterium]